MEISSLNFFKDDEPIILTNKCALFHSTSKFIKTFLK